jgi:hypothetical protein
MPTPNATPKPAEALNLPSTTIIAIADIGWGNTLYIRGDGIGLSWEKGIPMTNTHPDRWEWKTVLPSDHIEFKFLINDRIWCDGENLSVLAGGTSISSPSFE